MGNKKRMFSMGRREENMKPGQPKMTLKSRCSPSSPLLPSVGMDCPQGAQPSSAMATVPAAPGRPRVQASIMNAGREAGL